MVESRDALEVREMSTRKRRLNFRQIEVFRAVMVSGSINAAAQMLRTSQPNLSRMVRRTEDVLGFALFERSKGRLVPTKEAASLFSLVGHVFQQLDDIGDAIERMSRGESAVFRIGTTPSPGRCLVPKVVAQMHAALPALGFHIDVLLVDQIIDYLVMHRGECVVSIFPVRHALIQTKAIGIAKLVCLIPAGHRLADRTTIRVADLAAEYMIFFESETPHGTAAERLFESAGHHPRVGIRIRHIETAIGLVASGVGLAIVDEISVLDAPALPFTIARIEGSKSLNVYLNWNRETPRSQFQRIFETEVTALLAAKPKRPRL